MDYYIQYHNIAKEGLPLSDSSFGQQRLSIFTRRPNVEGALGGQVFMIAGVGEPRRYFQWDTFQIDRVDKKPGGYFVAQGSGWQLKPPQELTGKRFAEFRTYCANFVGFRRVSDHPYTRRLRDLAQAYRRGRRVDVMNFLRRLDGLMEEQGLDRNVLRRFLAQDRPVRALSIRQPHAEAILRGVKRVEYRSRRTRIRGRIWIYAGLTRYPTADESQLMEKYGINDVACDDLPRGVLVGTVELYDCDGGDWYVRKPERARRLLKPKNHPQPAWFNPF